MKRWPVKFGPGIRAIVGGKPSPSAPGPVAPGRADAPPPPSAPPAEPPPPPEPPPAGDAAAEAKRRRRTTRGLGRNGEKAAGLIGAPLPLEAIPVPWRIVVLPRRLPSQNQAMYRHWKTYTTERDVWLLLLRSHLPPRPRQAEPVRLEIVSYRTRLIDYANLVGGAKPIPDCLQRLGWLYDDSPRWFLCHYRQVQVKAAEERTELRFLPWEAAAPDHDGG